MVQLQLDGQPVEVTPRLSADRKRTLRRRIRLEQGYHPATLRRLADNGMTCGDCAAHRAFDRDTRTFHKCQSAGVTRGPATDIRVGWPACELFRAAE